MNTSAAKPLKMDDNSENSEFLLLRNLCDMTVHGQTGEGDFERLDEIIYKRLLSTYPGTDEHKP